MSDKKAAPNASFEQEFEKFLRDEPTQVGSTYRKLAQAEPDAQLDARVRALAQRALLDGRGNAAPRPRSARRWVPALASAAVLVLATGIVWRLGPHNWAGEKDRASAGAGASKVPPSSLPAPAEPAATGSQNRGAENETASTSALDSAATSARDSRNSPEPFPAPKPKSPLPSASADAATPVPAARRDDEKPSVLRNDALTAETNARAAAASTSALVREKSAAAESEFARGELKKSEALAPPASAAVPAQQRAPALETPTAPTQNAAPALQGAPVQMRETNRTATAGSSAAAISQETASPAPVPPVRSEESTPMVASSQSSVSKQDAGGAAREQNERDAPGGRRSTTAAEVVERSLDAGSAQTLAKRAFAAPPAPPPPPTSAPSPNEYPSKPLADAVTAPVPAPKAVMQAAPQQASTQGSEDRASPADVPNLRIAGRPTAAQLAAWPAPNCHSAGTVKDESQTWGYPPDVPGTAQLRFVTVKIYLDAQSREAALKAFADFRHCYPDDHWPDSLLRRLGTQ